MFVERPKLYEDFPPYTDVIKAVDGLGYEIWPCQEEGGVFRVVVFLNDIFLRKGKVEYDTWHEAMRETYFEFYKHFIFKKNGGNNGRNN